MEFTGNKTITTSEGEFPSLEYIHWLEDQLLDSQPRDYGLSRDLKEDDERHPTFLSQRLERGFDDTETWCLTTAICKFIVPRLKRFKEINIGYPSNLTFKKWNKILQKMIDAFEQDYHSPETDQKKFKKGLKLFTKYFGDLWL